MSIFNVFTLMGGIAMFLYGMDLMGKALEQTAGSKLQGILSKMTASPVRGLLLGMVLGMVASLIQGGQSGEEALLYLTISVAMALLAGSVTLPCSFLFSEEKNVLAIFLAYPAAAGIFAGVVVPLGVTPLSGSLVAGISVVLYAASWVLARRKIAFRDVA